MLRSCPSAAFVDGVKIGSLQLAGQLQPLGHRGAVHGPRLLVLLPGLPGQVAPDDALEREHLGPAHQDGPAGPFGGQRHAVERGRDLGGVDRQQGARHDVGHLLAPEARHRGQHPALVGDRLGHDDVERAHPVRGDHEQPVLRRRRRARGPCPSGPGAAPPSQVHQRVGEAVDVAEGAGEVEGRIELGGVQRHVGVRFEDVAEGAPLGPGLARVALDDPVGLVAGQAGGDEGQEDRLGEDEAERALGQVGRGARSGWTTSPAASPVALRSM